MRIDKSLKNIYYAVLSYGSIFILSLILRKVFLKYLDVELLGIEGVLGNLFSLMALVDVGTGSLITYLLYKAFSENDKEEVSILMGMYRNMYFLIAVVMTLISIILIPLLPYFISSETVEWKYVLCIYFMKLLGMIGSYCYSYRRLLFKVDQCEFVCTKVDMITCYLKYTSWLAVLLAWHSYFLYLSVEILAVLGANIYIACLSKIKYPYATGKGVGLREYRERNFFKDMKNTYLIKIARTIFGSTDNLVVSVFLGLKSVALLSNYLLITTTISQGFAKLLMPLRGSIGNFVYQETNERCIQLFKMFDMFAFVTGSTIACVFACSVNCFISLWIGNQYTFDMTTVIFISYTLYFGFVSHFTTCFRDVLGRFELDRNYAISGALLNIIISILLVKQIGIAGVYIGTIFGVLGFWSGRYRVLKTDLFKRGIGYFVIQTKYLTLYTLFLCSSYILCKCIDNSIIGFGYKILISFIVPFFLNYIIFRKSREFEMIKSYMMQSLKILRKR